MKGSPMDTKDVRIDNSPDGGGFRLQEGGEIWAWGVAGCPTHDFFMMLYRPTKDAPLVMRFRVRVFFDDKVFDSEDPKFWYDVDPGLELDDHEFQNFVEEVWSEKILQDDPFCGQEGQIVFRRTADPSDVPAIMDDISSLPGVHRAPASGGS